MEGLETLTNMRTLYLQENVVKKIEGLDNLTLISNINLSDNRIQKIEGLATLAKLSALQLKRNDIGYGGLDDLRGLLKCLSISALDISDNKIEDKAIIEEILMKMSNLTVLYM
jgi:hypothetical protein